MKHSALDGIFYLLLAMVAASFTLVLTTPYAKLMQALFFLSAIAMTLVYCLQLKGAGEGRWLYIRRLAGLTWLVTLGLITLGGVVHSTDSGLACPNWPLCYDEVSLASLFPTMEAGVLYEHSHRMLGALVGLCAIGLCVGLWPLANSGKRMRPWGIAILGLVIFQGVLGGITVHFSLPTIVSTAHLGMSMVVFGILTWIVCLAWAACAGERSENSITYSPRWASVRRWLMIALVLCYCQIVLGAFVRHSGAFNAAGAGPQAAIIGYDYALGKATIWPGTGAGKVNMIHRMAALVVAGWIILACTRAWAITINRKLKVGGWKLILAPVLVCFQIAVGVGMIAMGFQIVMRTMHLTVGALVLASVIAALHVTRLAALHDKEG